jgi:hypothetical protein
MIVRTVLAAAIALSAVTSALAQMPPQPPPPKMPTFPTSEGDEKERAACHPDVVKFCADAIPDQFRILSCLQTNRPKISNACRGVLSSHGV